jgi:threonine dehydratase
MGEVERAATWPIRFQDVLAAQKRIRPWVAPTALRRYAPLDAEVGRGIQVWVKHENQAPTNSFKVRNACSALTRLTPDERRRGVVAATRGNHGLGLAFAGSALGIPITVCVPRGNNPEKNEGMQGYGATIVEDGADYDESVKVAQRLVDERGMRLVHSTNDRDVIAGAGTLTLEILGERPDLDALVVAVGGGSQAVGAMTVARALKPSLAVYAVQAAGARAAHDSFHAGRPVEGATADTFADGLATRSVYALTFEALREGLSGFVAVEESEIAEAIRLLLRTTHNLAEGAGAAGLAGLLRLRETLSGKKVAVIVSGGNIDAVTLRRVLQHEL